MKQSKRDIKRILMLIILSTFAIGSFIFLTIRDIKYVNLAKDDLTPQTLGLSSVEVKNKGYELIFINSEDKYYIESKVSINEDLLLSIQSGDEVSLYVIESRMTGYDYEIIEMYVDSQTIVTIENYYNQYKLTVIIYLSIVLFLFFLTILYIFLLKRFPNLNAKPITINLDDKATQDKYNLLKSSFYYKNKSYRSNVLNHLDGDVDILMVVAFDLMNNGELRLVYDDACEDESMLFLFYRNHDKLLFEYVSKNNDGKFELSADYYSWNYPLYEQLTNMELECYQKILKQYSQLNPDEVTLMDNDRSN